MAFCKFSSEYVISSQTPVDNFFINEFLPYANPLHVKVYIYGLYKCTHPDTSDNNLADFARNLSISVEEVEEAFEYWKEQGLVQILQTTEIQIRFMPIKNVINNTRKFKIDKYTDFNLQAQQIIEGRMITSNEYVEYYTLMESFHIEQAALLMIMEYCTQIKGQRVGYPYILTVAKNWAQEGIVTAQGVEEHIQTLSASSSDVVSLLKLCGFKRKPTVEEYDLFMKWTTEWDFKREVIHFVANAMITKGSKLTFDKLDVKMKKYYEIRALTIKEIEDFETEKNNMYDLARKVNTAIGVYYQNLEVVVEQFISSWLSLGHNADSILTLASYCFKNNIRTLNGVDNVILKLYKLGIVSTDAINEYIHSLAQNDAEIKEILLTLGLSRNVTNSDREFYKTWKIDWQMPAELVNFAVSLSVGKFMPLQNVNKLLSTWHSKHIESLADAKKCTSVANSALPKVEENKGKSFNKEELDALFDSLEDIDL